MWHAMNIQHWAIMLVILTFGWCGPSWTVKAQSPADFETLLAETGLSFRSPAGGIELPPRAVPGFSFQKALRFPAQGGVEMRLAVRPLSRMRIDYQDPHSSAPEPDHVFPLVFSKLTALLAGSKASKSREYPSDKAQDLFRADWAAAAIFDLDPDLAENYTSGLLLAVHKSRFGDGYILFLFNDARAAKPFLEMAQNSLSF